LVQEAV
jgi:hypothetical protein